MAAVDTFNSSGAVGSSAPNGAAVTPSDSVDLGFVTRALYVGVTGDIVATMQGGGDVTFKAVPAGAVLPIRVTRVKATNTTATNILALW